MNSIEIFSSNLPYNDGGLFIDMANLSDKDKKVILELDKKHFPNPWNESGWDMVWSSERSFVLLVAKNDFEMMGYSLYSIELHENDFLAHLVKIVVNPKFRNQGLAKSIIQRFEIIQNIAKHSIYLEVEETNIAAINLYKSCGLSYVHTKKHFYGQGRHALIFMKAI